MKEQLFSAGRLMVAVCWGRCRRRCYNRGWGISRLDGVLPSTPGGDPADGGAVGATAYVGPEALGARRPRVSCNLLTSPHPLRWCYRRVAVACRSKSAKLWR